MTTAIQKRGGGVSAGGAKDLRSMLMSMDKQIAMALPKHLTSERMIRLALTAYQTTPALQKCTDISIVGAVVQASQLGLEFGGPLGEAYPVPFRNSKTGNMECQLIPGYRGLIKLARNSGQVGAITAEVVHERDEFDVVFGLDPDITHKPAWRIPPSERGEIIAAYACAKLANGDKQFAVMSREEIDAIRARSKAKDSGPWVTDYAEMCKKTVLRRLYKLLPSSVEMATAMRLADAADAGEPQRFEVADALDVHAEEAVTEAAEPDETDARETVQRSVLVKQIPNLLSEREIGGDAFDAMCEGVGILTPSEWDSASVTQLEGLRDAIQAVEPRERKQTGRR